MPTLRQEAGRKRPFRRGLLLPEENISKRWIDGDDAGDEGEGTGDGQGGGRGSWGVKAPIDVVLAGLFGDIPEPDDFYDAIFEICAQRPRVTNLSVTPSDLWDLPLSQFARFVEKLDEERSKDIEAQKKANGG
jgi:hypothetical protein